MKSLKLLAVITILSLLYSFSWKKCNIFLKNGSLFGERAISSTSSSVSSTGECRMIGAVEHDKKLFIAQNSEYLKLDIAKGNGEYLSSYISILNCTDTGSIQVKNLSRQNYITIFSSRAPESIYNQLEDILNKDNVYKSNCGKI